MARFDTFFDAVLDWLWVSRAEDGWRATLQLQAQDAEASSGWAYVLLELSGVDWLSLKGLYHISVQSFGLQILWRDDRVHLFLNCLHHAPDDWPLAHDIAGQVSAAAVAWEAHEIELLQTRLPSGRPELAPSPWQPPSRAWHLGPQEDLGQGTVLAQPVPRWDGTHRLEALGVDLASSRPSDGRTSHRLHLVSAPDFGWDHVSLIDVETLCLALTLNVERPLEGELRAGPAGLGQHLIFVPPSAELPAEAKGSGREWASGHRVELGLRAEGPQAVLVVEAVS